MVMEGEIIAVVVVIGLVVGPVGLAMAPEAIIAVITMLIRIPRVQGVA